jgi:hypothetical protein
MALVHLSLLAGILLIGVPIAVHLAMRPQPVRHMFPALQFVRERQQTSQRRLKLKRFLLLFLRCLVIAVAAIALARPAVTHQQWSVWGAAGAAGIVAVIAGIAAAASWIQKRGRWLSIGLVVIASVLLIVTMSLSVMALQGETPTLLGDQEAPVSAILLVDTAPRMDYQYRNRTRLAEAKKIAAQLVEQFPRESEVAVLDSEGTEGVFSPDRSAANTVLDKIEVSGGARPLFEQIDQAMQLAKAAEHERRELYLFTDMTTAAWNGDRADAWDEAAIQRLRELLVDSDMVVYVIDVGVESRQNASLGQPRIESDTMVLGSELQISVPVRADGDSFTKTVELWLEASGDVIPQMEDGKLAVRAMVKRGSVPVSASEESPGTAKFAVNGLKHGLSHGQIRLLGDDSLSHDNTRYFSILVRDAWPILIVAPKNVSTSFATHSLSPAVSGDESGWRFECTTVGIRELANQKLSEYAAVCLLDPTPLTEPQWGSLKQYVEQGGGLALMLGHNAQPTRAFQLPYVRDVLGGTLGRQWRRTDGTLFLDPQEFSHPIMAPFREIQTTTPWNTFPIFRHWSVDDLAESAEVLIRYGNTKEALIENRLGAGRVLCLTTPISDPARPVGRTPWNELAFGEDGWPQFILLNEIVNYLVSDAEQQLNFPTGRTASLIENRGVDIERFQLYPPDQAPYQVIVQDQRVTIRNTTHPGNYRLRGRRGVDVILGMSANYEPFHTALAPMAPERLAEIFGDDRLQVLRGTDEIERAQGRNRVGREFYPVLMIMLALIVCLEQLLANRFYSARAAKE